MCNCINEVSSAFRENAERIPDVKRVNYALLPATMCEVPKVAIRMTINCDIALKNGNVKNKDIFQNVVASFCPFCGEKYE